MNSPPSTPGEKSAPPYAPNRPPHVEHYTWHPGVFSHPPLMALLALLLALASTVGSIIIIVISQNQPATWKIQPQVLLGFLAGFAAAMLGLALAPGVAITWWRTAMSPQGTTMAKLHYIWSYGGHSGESSSPWLAGRRLNKVALAFMLTAVTGIAYGPLIQRATRTEGKNLSTNTTMFLDITSTLPSGYAGTVGSDPEKGPVLSWPFLTDIQNWYGELPLYTQSHPSYLCNGTCTGSVLAPGLLGTGGGCSTIRRPINLKQAAANGTQVFSINFTRFDDLETIPTLEMMVQYITAVDAACVGTLVTTVCQVQAGTVQYPVVIQNDTINIDVSITELAPEGFSYADPGDLSTAAPGAPAGPLSAIQWFGNTYYWSNATLDYNATSNTWLMYPVGIPAQQYFDTFAPDYIPSLQCTFQWTDPSLDILSDFSQVLFYAGMDADYPPTPQNFTAVRTQYALIYHSEYSYLAAATAIIMLALLGVSSTLYGWWELGREVSLSPLETAKAFGAQVFQVWNYRMDGAHLTEDIGETRKFRYGELMLPQTDGPQDDQRPLLAIGELDLEPNNDPIVPHTI